MFLIHIYFPIAVLVILFEQLVESRPDNIVGLYIFAQENLITGLSESVIVLIILIASELFVEKTYFVEHFAFVGAEGDGIHKALFVACAEVGVAHSKWLRHGIADNERFLVGVAVGEDAAATTDVLVGKEHFEIAFYKVLLNGAVGSEDDNHIAVVVVDAYVERIGRGQMRIANPMNVWILFFVLSDDVVAAVATAAIGHNDTQMLFRKGAVDNGLQAVADVLHLVATGNHDSNALFYHGFSIDL